MTNERDVLAYLDQRASEDDARAYLSGGSKPTGGTVLDYLKGAAKQVAAIPGRFGEGVSDIGAAFETGAAKIDKMVGADPTQSLQRAANLRARSQTIRDILPQPQSMGGQFFAEAARQTPALLASEVALSAITPTKIKAALEARKVAKGATVADRATNLAVNTAKRAVRGAAEGAAYGTVSGEGPVEQAKSFALINPVLGGAGEIAAPVVRAAATKFGELFGKLAEAGAAPNAVEAITAIPHPAVPITTPEERALIELKRRLAKSAESGDPVMDGEKIGEIYRTLLEQDPVYKAAQAGTPEAAPAIKGIVGPGMQQRVTNMAQGIGEAVNPDEYVNVAKFALDQPGEQRLRDEVTNVVREHGLAPKQVVSWEQTKAVAQSLGLEPNNISKTGKMSAPEMLAVRNIVKSNIDATIAISQQLATGLDAAGKPLAPDVAQGFSDRLAAMESQNDAMLSRFIKDRSQTGRDLNSLKILANASMDPVVWMARAQRLSGGPLPDAVRADIQRLATMNDRQQLAKYVADLRKSTLGEKLNTFWKAGLLSAPPTHLLNITSTAAMVGMETAKDVPAFVLDRVVSTITKMETKSLNVGDQVTASVRGAKQGAKDAASMMRGATPDVMQKIDVFKQTNYDSPILNAWTKGVFRTLGAEDSFFKAIAASRSVAEQATVLARREGLRGEALAARVSELTAQPSDEMALRAISDAEKATFNNKTLLGKAGSSLASVLEPVGGKYALPFTGTPGAVATAVVNYSPLGYLSTAADAVKLFKAVAEKNKSAIPTIQRDLVDSFGRSTTGTAPILAGYLLYKHGLMSLGYPQASGERGQWDATGQQENAVKIGDEWKSLGRLSPIGNLLVLGGYIAKAAGDTQSSMPSRVMQPVASIAKTVTEQSFMQGARQVLDAMSDPSANAGKLAESFVSSWVPAIVKRSARWADPTVREKSGIKDALVGSVPGMSKSLPAKVEPLGTEVKKPEGFVSSMLDPSYATKALDVNDPVRAEMRRLDAQITTRGKVGGETPQKYESRMKLEGGTLKKEISALIASEEYRSLDGLAQQALGNSGVDPQEAADIVKKKMIEDLIGAKRTAFTKYERSSGMVAQKPKPTVVDLLRAR